MREIAASLFPRGNTSSSSMQMTSSCPRRSPGKWPAWTTRARMSFTGIGGTNVIMEMARLNWEKLRLPVRRLTCLARYWGYGGLRMARFFSGEALSSVSGAGTSRYKPLRIGTSSLSVAMAGARIEYQPGAHFIYRRHGQGSITTSNRLSWLENHRRVSEKAVAALKSSQRLSKEYRRNLARFYFRLARAHFDLDRDKYQEIMDELLALDTEFRPNESTFYNVTQRLLGFRIAEQLASRKRRLLKRIRA